MDHTMEESNLYRQRMNERIVKSENAEERFGTFGNATLVVGSIVIPHLRRAVEIREALTSTQTGRV